MALLQETLRSLHARDWQHGSKQSSLFSVGISFIIVTLFVVSLRIYVRTRLLGLRMAKDDYLMVAGAFCTMMLSVTNMISGWYGTGERTRDIRPQDYTPMLKANLATRLLYVFASCLVKFSILVFYQRLDPRRRTRLIVYFLMAWVLALSIMTFFSFVLTCIPTSVFWDLAAQAKNPEKCMSSTTRQIFYNINNVMNIMQDLAIYLVPVLIVSNLQMPQAQKFALAALLGVGLVAVAAGCVRFYYVLFLVNKVDDVYYYMADSLNWYSIEIYIGIICSCASTFKILISRFIPKISHYVGRSNGQSTGKTPRNPREGSHSDQIFMKRLSSNRLTANRKYGVEGITEIGNESQEAMVKSQ
ncbi:hypothetical protein COCMIDRAFT_4920 [Bipolaris oryzae ATCC 44560]|uniref:Rhodopsin domain-containing protein n=1 Tax=Bipolaris oryzae ATCC 44560 TaxID=930090 RepID=W6Z7J8_COCMI|nr:uncharacterized protein COCMIDRAFT_4920 [Bipolaris oryzae ATCC 44560]EUC45985.1 hypothetical protein COCMIDRAFT_4920 [Bipolaris oryzae ATCC 44560]